MKRAWAPLLLLALAVVIFFRRADPARVVDVPPSARAKAVERSIPSTSPASAEKAPAVRLSPRTAFERLIEALRLKDRGKAVDALEDLRIAFLPEPVPDDQNAALIYKVAFERLQAIEESEDDGDLIDRAGGELTPEELVRLRELVERRRDVLLLLRKAAERPRCDFGVKYEEGFNAELPHIAPLLRAARLLRAEAVLGGGDPAVALRLAEAVADEPLFISQLVRGVGHNLAAETLERAFDGELTGLRRALPSAESLRTGMERSLLTDLYAGAKAMLEGDTTSLGPGAERLRSFDDPLAAEDLAYYGQSLRRMSDLVGQPYWEVRDRLNQAQADLVDRAPVWAILARQAMPSFAKAASRLAESEARIGTSTIAAALRTYRDAQGGYPQSLASLGVALPLDPFTGQPYLYRREGEGFVVWSVGEDRLDGGAVAPENDIRFRAKR